MYREFRELYLNTAMNSDGVSVRLVPHLVLASDVKDAQFDGVVIIRDTAETLTGPLQVLHGSVQAYLQVCLVFV